MARARKSDKSAGSKSKSTAPLDDDEQVVEEGEEELPKDEAGRRKIKRQYEELLGIRIEKLKGRILNRERINKTLEGIYFICARCEKVCHNLDEGLVEDEKNVNNLCVPCAKASQSPLKATAGSKADARKEKDGGAKPKSPRSGRTAR